MSVTLWPPAAIMDTYPPDGKNEGGDPVKYELGQRIAAARRLRGMTQDELGLLVNASRQSISHWEKGISTPSFEVLCELVQLLNMDISDLLGMPRTDE